MRKSPCVGCKDRCIEPNCHDDHNCPHGYREWAEEQAAAKKYNIETSTPIHKSSFDGKCKKVDRAPNDSCRIRRW